MALCSSKGCRCSNSVSHYNSRNCAENRIRGALGHLRSCQRGNNCSTRSVCGGCNAVTDYPCLTSCGGSRVFYTGCCGSTGSCCNECNGGNDCCHNGCCALCNDRNGNNCANNGRNCCENCGDGVCGSGCGCTEICSAGGCACENCGSCVSGCGNGCEGCLCGGDRVSPGAAAEFVASYPQSCASCGSVMFDGQCDVDGCFTSDGDAIRIGRDGRYLAIYSVSLPACENASTVMSMALNGSELYASRAYVSPALHTAARSCMGQAVFCAHAGDRLTLNTSVGLTISQTAPKSPWAVVTILKIN